MMHHLAGDLGLAFPIDIGNTRAGFCPVPVRRCLEGFTAQSCFCPIVAGTEKALSFLWNSD